MSTPNPLRVSLPFKATLRDNGEPLTFEEVQACCLRGHNGRQVRDHKDQVRIERSYPGSPEAIGWTVFFRRPKAYAYEGDPIFRSERQVRRHFRQTFVPEVEDNLMLSHHLFEKG